MTNSRLDEQVIIITGAARGLGREHALLMAAHGATIVVNDAGTTLDGSSDSSPAADVVAEIESAGGQASYSTDRVDDPDAAAALVAGAVERWGRIDAIVHNAGILRDATVAKMTHEDLTAVLDVHLIGAFNVICPALPHLRESAAPRIVLTTSASGLFGNFGQANYAAAKMGLVGLMNVLALEGERWGLRVNTVAPSARTRMTETLLGGLADSLDPAHVSPLVAYLCAPECEVNREIYAAGGGRFARVVIGVTPGWCTGPDHVATVEEIAEHLASIRSMEGHIVPTSGDAELRFLRAAVKATEPGPVRL